MKVEAVVYESQTGFTKRYAELLSQLTGLVAFERKTAGTHVKKGAEIFYMGWMMAGSVKGLSPFFICRAGLTRASSGASISS